MSEEKAKKTIQWKPEQKKAIGARNVSLAVSAAAGSGKTAVLTERIVELLADPERRKRMGEFGRNRVINELSWEHTSKALLEGYEKFFTGVFDGKKRAPAGKAPAAMG